MIKLFYDLMSQPARAVYIFLSVNKIPFQKCPTLLHRAEHLSDEYAKVNPLKVVPAIDDNGFKLGESIAIIRYLTREYSDKIADNWYPQESKAQARVDQYLEWQHLNTRVACAMYFRLKYIEPLLLGRQAKESDIKQFEERMVKVLEQFETVWLKDHSFVNGDKISVADIMALCELQQPSMAGYDVFAGHPNVTSWFRRTRDLLQPHYDEASEIVYKICQKQGFEGPSAKL